jgi:hypothetical protein
MQTAKWKVEPKQELRLTSAERQPTMRIRLTQKLRIVQANRQKAADSLRIRLAES